MQPSDQDRPGDARASNSLRRLEVSGLIELFAVRHQLNKKKPLHERFDQAMSFASAEKNRR